MLASVSKDSLTTDEGLYLPTGYYYLTEQKANIGYEHPPLIRDFATIPLLFLPLKPASSFLNAQDLQNLEGAAWALGDRFLYGQSIGPDTLLWYARVPMVALTLVLGFFLFAITRNFFGQTAARFSLGLYALSPFFLAHGRLLTMDVPSAFGCLATFYTFYQFLLKPSWRNTLIAGVILGISLLVKFPLLSLVPFLILMSFVWIWMQKESGDGGAVLKRLVPLLFSALAVIYVVYAFHIWNYPQSEHVSDIIRTFQMTRGHAQSQLHWIADLAGISFLRPVAHYLFGMSWQMSRTGAFGYFMGEGSYTSWLGFYPFGYFSKNPIAFHLLALLAILFGLRKASFKNFWTTLSVAWIAYYLFILIFVNKGNTGSRYLIPILPFIFMLIARELSELWVKPKLAVFIAVMLLAQAVSVLRVHPSYLAYFNEAAGGAEFGSQYLVDTDSDWGQDARRLALWAEEKGISEIQIANGLNIQSYDNPNAFDFNFSSSDFRYYLGGRYRQYVTGSAGPVKGWFAIPMRIMRWGQTNPADNQGWYSQSYGWLKSYQPKEKIGYSIWVYYFE